MATYIPSQKPKPIEVDKFLGLNESVGDTEIKIGEAIYMRNFRITPNYKLEKRSGHTTFIDETQPTKAIQGMWYGRLGTDLVLIYACNGNIKKKIMPSGALSTLGTMTDAKTNIFYFNGKVYFQNGTQYKYYDGTTFGDVTSIAYIPTVLTGCTPTLSTKTVFETFNQLTGKKKNRYVGDGTTLYTLGETSIDATLVTATVNGVAKAETTDFTVDRTTGIVTFTVAPASQADVYITWEKASTVTPSNILNNRSSVIFGPGNATTVFMWGNTSARNKRVYSYPLDATYFPVENFTLIGSDAYAITDMQPQQSNLMIFKEERAYYSTADVNTITGGYDYPVFDLNYAVGNTCFDGVQVLNDTPYSLYGKNVYKWGLTYTASERSAIEVSDRMPISFGAIDFTTAKTFDFQKEQELWINVGAIVYVYNYGNDTWYIYDGITANCFIEIDSVLYYGGTNGMIERFDGAKSDNATAINSVWKSGFIDFGAYEYLKNSSDMWFSIQPASRTSVSIKCPTNKKNEEDPSLKTFSKGYTLFDFEDMDFEDFSFETNRNPQTFKIKINTRNYTYIQFIFSNTAIDESLVFLSFKVLCEVNNLI